MNLQPARMFPNDQHIYFYIFGKVYRYHPSQENYIGGGAMGDVYRGERAVGNYIIDKKGRIIPQDNNCYWDSGVAIKRVKDCFANNKMIRERAILEGNLCFRHPNLIEMLGCCATHPDEGPIFLLSNIVNGENVDVFVKNFENSPTRVEKISSIIAQALDGLDYMHSRGVVHRDIKPSNIMVENNSNVRLMDLGIARMSGGNQYSLNGFIGTPDYASPEQIKRDVNYNPQANNSSDGIDAQSDIYSLGIVFYELLTGENPMRASESDVGNSGNAGNSGNNGMSSADAQTLVNQINKKLPSNSKVPSKLMQVILKATEKEKAKRYKTALEFRQAIKDAFIPDPTPWEQFGNWLQKNAIFVIGSVFAFVVIVIILLLISM